MTEYRLPDNCHFPKDIVLCKIYRKATSLKALEERAAMEELKSTQMKNNTSPSSTTTVSPSMETLSFFSPKEDFPPSISLPQVVFSKEIKEEEENMVLEEKNNGNENKITSSTLQLPFGKEILPELQLPKMLNDWSQDQFWAQLNSPWFQNLIPYANILNF